MSINQTRVGSSVIPAIGHPIGNPDFQPVIGDVHIVPVGGEIIGFATVEFHQR